VHSLFVALFINNPLFFIDSEPSVLREHAKHFETGESVPEDLLRRLKAAQLFNEGFATVEYTACALLDIAIHSLPDYDDDFDISKFEKEFLEEHGMPQGIVMRHRPAHFAHLFASSGYAAGYYVYQWYVVAYHRILFYLSQASIHYYFSQNSKCIFLEQGTSAGQRCVRCV
jgi:Zn-dependent oligopeptidase